MHPHISNLDELITCLCISLTVGGRQSTWRESTLAQGEHANYVLKGPKSQLGIEPKNLAVRHQCELLQLLLHIRSSRAAGISLLFTRKPPFVSTPS